METKSSPQDIIAEVSAAARRTGLNRHVTRDIAAMAIIGADSKVSLWEARRLVDKLLPT